MTVQSNRVVSLVLVLLRFFIGSIKWWEITPLIRNNQGTGIGWTSQSYQMSRTMLDIAFASRQLLTSSPSHCTARKHKEMPSFLLTIEFQSLFSSDCFSFWHSNAINLTTALLIVSCGRWGWHIFLHQEGCGLFLLYVGASNPVQHREAIKNTDLIMEA